MNGVHDMGGMQDMGLVQYEKDEPVFHAPWGGRVYAMNRALAAWRKWNLDASRRTGELIPPADYFRMSYYEKWLAGLHSLMVERNLLERAEIDSGKPAPGSGKATPPVNRGGITKAGNGRARRILVEAAWSYRYPPRVSREKQMKVAAAPRAAREIAWKAQMRLCGRFRSLTRKGKRPNVVVTAIARELSAFIWAINREVVGSHATAN